MKNHFEATVDAERYASARPDFHPVAARCIQDFTRPNEPFGRALDVGCGTGQSTEAVAEIATSVVGIDPSKAMLSQAQSGQNIEFQEATAEALPFSDGSFDLVTVAQAFHWLDVDRFLAEARRVLSDDGWLVIYGGWFTAKVRERSDFEEWFREDYLQRYPSPKRGSIGISDELAKKHGFDLCGDESFESDIEMSAERFTDYQISTTNIIAALDAGESLAEIECWLHEALAKFFEGQNSRTFQFAGHIWYLTKDSNS